MSHSSSKRHSPSVYLFLLGWLSLFTSCQEQDVISNLQADLAKIEVTVENNGSFGSHDKESLVELKVSLRNLSNSMPATALQFPRLASLPDGLWYTNAPQRNMFYLNGDFVKELKSKKDAINKTTTGETENIEKNFEEIKISKEVLNHLEEEFFGNEYILKKKVRSNCKNIPGTQDSPNFSCSFTLALYSQDKTNFFYPFLIKYNDGIKVQTIVINLTGDVSSPGVIHYTTKSHSFYEEYYQSYIEKPDLVESLDFELTAFGKERRKKIYLFNYGERDIQIYRASISKLTSPYFNFSGESFPGKNGTCSQIIPPKKVCTLEISFTPKVAMNPENFNSETYNELLKVSYTDSLSKRVLTIPIAGAAKEERGRVSIVRPVNSNPLAGCLTPVGQSCLSLGDLPLGAVQDFTVTLENEGLIVSKLHYPKIKLEPLGFDSIFIDLESPLNNHIEWLGFNENFETIDEVPPCKEQIESKERCNLFFKYHTSPIDLNPLSIKYGELSRLISFEYEDNDIVNPQIKMANIIGSEKLQLEDDNIKNRINVISNVVELGKIQITGVLEDDIFERLNNGFSRIDRIYKFAPQELSPIKPQKVKFSFENKGAFEVKDIKVVTKNLTTSEIYQFNTDKCPEILPAYDEQNIKRCEIVITASSNQKGIFEEEFSLQFFDGIKTTQMDYVKIISSFSNSANLQFNFHLENLAGAFTPKNSTNTNFPISSKTPKIRLDISNKGNGNATIKKFETPLEAICEEGLLVPLTLTSYPETSCLENYAVAPDTDLQKNHCSVFFDFDIDESTINTESDEAINCLVIFKLSYDDDLSLTRSNFILDEGLENLYEIEMTYKRDIGFDFKLGEAASITPLNEEDYQYIRTLSDKNERQSFLDTRSDPLIDFGHNALGFPIKKNVFLWNSGKLSASNPSINLIPSTEFVIDSRCSLSIGPSNTCSATVTYTPTLTGFQTTDAKVKFETSIQELSSNHQVIGTGGNYGYIVALDEGLSNLIENRVYDFGKFVVFTNNQLVVTFKNIGQGSIEGLQFSDNTSTTEVITNEEGDEQEVEVPDENKRLNQSSSCLGPGLTLNPNESCEIIYDVFINEPGPKSINVNVSYQNPVDEKEYSMSINYRGRTPPEVKPNFTGENAPHGFDFDKVSVGLSSEKRFDFTNIGQSDASDFSVEIINDPFGYYKIFYDTCNNTEKNLGGTDTCSIKIRYSPLTISQITVDDEQNINYSPHEAQLKVTYDPIISKQVGGEQDIGTIQPFYPAYVINLSGISVVPPSKFSTYTDIKTINHDGDTSITFSWDTFTAEDPEVLIDSYNIYMREDEPLPKKNELLENYHIQTIDENTYTSRTYSTTNNYPPGKKLYFTIRAKYFGNLLEIEESEQSQNPWDLKIIIPPKNMGLIHPFIANDLTCREMKYRPDFEDYIREENELFFIEQLPPPKSVNFSCPTEKVENDNFIPGESQYIYNYYDLGKFLFVDLYELSETNNGSTYISEPGMTPKEFTIPTAATQACGSVLTFFGSETINKRLLTRQEWFAAAAWSPELSQSQINKIEKGENASTDCYYNTELKPKRTGERSSCVSRYGMYDMPGNVWEWNSNQINVIIGLDYLLGEYLLLPGGASIQFPYDIPCFDFIHGIGRLETSANGITFCDKGISGKTISVSSPSYYFPPNPMNNSVKNIRSGGGVGERVGMDSSSIKRTGRFVVDLDSYSGLGTGARCGFSIPYSSN